MARPRYQQDVCERLRRAARSVLIEPRWPKERMAMALQAIIVLTPDEFPADFRSDFEEILTAIDGSSIDQAVAAMDDQALARMAERIVVLHHDACGAGRAWAS